MSQITIIGHLGKNAERASTPQGTELTKFTVAVSNGYGDKKTTDWFDVIKWGKVQEYTFEKLTKGATVCVTGKFQQVSNEYNGKEYKKLQITATEILVLKDTEEAPQSKREPKQEEIPF